MNDQSRAGKAEKQRAVKSTSLPRKDTFSKKHKSYIASLSKTWEIKESHWNTSYLYAAEAPQEDATPASQHRQGKQNFPIARKDISKSRRKMVPMWYWVWNVTFCLCDCWPFLFQLLRAETALVAKTQNTSRQTKKHIVPTGLDRVKPAWSAHQHALFITVLFSKAGCHTGWWLPKFTALPGQLCCPHAPKYAYWHLHVVQHREDYGWLSETVRPFPLHILL